MQELRFMTAIMKEKLNLRLGAEVVHDIVLKAGRVTIPVAEVPDESRTPHPLTLRQQALIETQSAAITDPETRQAFIELMHASLEQR
jgi:hypothetical protein